MTDTLVERTYVERRARIETYFDRTAREAWTQLTSDVPLSGIRATVRAGRDRMRERLLSWLPDDLTGARILDAGCGTGALSVAAALRGAHVVAIDISASLISVARSRVAASPVSERIAFHVGDMLSKESGTFDYVVSMDSLIHYEMEDMVRSLTELASRARERVLFTFAPQTPALTVMHAVGRWFPRADRAPAIVPVAQRRLIRAVADEPRLSSWRCARHERIVSGFYLSHAMELARQ